MSLLSLGNQRPLLRRELSRRIGYTNGLHDIFRFSRTVAYLHQIAPASSSRLRGLVLEKESIQGKKYADGVIEVAGALGLIAKVGTKLTLSDRGYALNAIQRTAPSGEAERALLLSAILESDGDATLNLLELIRLGSSPASLGPSLSRRLLEVLQRREEWIRNRVEDRISRELVLRDLADSQERLEQALDPTRKKSQVSSSFGARMKLTPQERVTRFYDHTVLPRRGWLKDLGCLTQEGKGRYVVTASGFRLLDSLRSSTEPSQSALALPFSADILEVLGVTGAVDSDTLLWPAIARFFKVDQPNRSLSTSEFFRLIRAIYPHVKLPVFNEATVDSLYHVVASYLAIEGGHLDRDRFERHLDSVCLNYPSDVHRLDQRQGRSGYISMPHNARTSPT